MNFHAISISGVLAVQIGSVRKNFGMCNKRKNGLRSDPKGIGYLLLDCVPIDFLTLSNLSDLLLVQMSFQLGLQINLIRIQMITRLAIS